jgi:uncharacterized membrane protein YGL010W
MTRLDAANDSGGAARRIAGRAALALALVSVASIVPRLLVSFGAPLMMQKWHMSAAELNVFLTAFYQRVDLFAGLTALAALALGIWALRRRGGEAVAGMAVGASGVMLFWWLMTLLAPRLLDGFVADWFMRG